MKTNKSSFSQLDGISYTRCKLFGCSILKYFPNWQTAQFEISNAMNHLAKYWYLSEDDIIICLQMAL